MASKLELPNNCSESEVEVNRKLAALNEENALLKKQLEGLIIQKEIKQSKVKVHRKVRREKQKMKKKDAIALKNETESNPNMAAGKTKVSDQSEKVMTGLKEDEEQNAVSSQSENFSTIKRDEIISITSNVEDNAEHSGNRNHQTSDVTPDEPDSIFPSLRSILNWVLYDKLDIQEPSEPGKASENTRSTDSKTVLDTANDDNANMKDEQSDDVENNNNSYNNNNNGTRTGRERRKGGREYRRFDKKKKKP